MFKFSKILIRARYSKAKTVGLINVHFEQATEDIDLTNMLADTDIEKRKSLLFISGWPEIVETNKALFIPR